MKFQAVVIGAGCSVWMWMATAAPENSSGSPIKLPEKPVETWIQELADDQFRVREEASRQLWKLGELALPALQAAADGKQPEQAYRARELIRKIELFITPDTDPSIINLVERYAKASVNEKRGLYEKLRIKKAWRQILKLYAAETQPELQAAYQVMVDTVAVTAARECLLRGDAAAAREFLEMAPADASGLLALADFHRSQGSLDGELKRALTLQGPKAFAWQLALYRVSGNIAAAKTAAEAAGETKIAAAMAVLAGDPLPWMRDSLREDDGGRGYKPYVDLAIKRWKGIPLKASDLDALERSANSRNGGERENGINALFSLGETTLAQKALVKGSPQQAFSYFDSLEMVPEALACLGLAAESPDYAGWVEERMRRYAKGDEEDAHDSSVDTMELVLMANFLERHGLAKENDEAFLKPLAELAEEDDKKFAEFLGMLFASRKTSEGGAPSLAAKAATAWAGEKEERWEDLLGAAFGEVDEVMELWDWMLELDPAASHAERLDGLLALTGKSLDPRHLREHWLALAWTLLEKTPEHQPVLEKLARLSALKPDLANNLRLWKFIEKTGNTNLRRPHDLELALAGRWDEAADMLITGFERELKDRREPDLKDHARAAAYLRRAGRLPEAAEQDALLDKLALGRDALAIGTGYLYGGDMPRAIEWYARAYRQADPEEDEFISSLIISCDYLIDAGDWQTAASFNEVLALTYAFTDVGVGDPNEKLLFRLQADFSRALAGLKTHRAESVALLERCHRMGITSGSLADYFFPSLRKVGLLQEHDEWFNLSWDALSAVARKYPLSDNTRNTTAWLASRSMRNLDQAEGFIKEALALNPEEPNYLDTVAEIHFARGNREKALEWSSKALNLAPGSLVMMRQHEHFRTDPLPR